MRNVMPMKTIQFHVRLGVFLLALKLVDGNSTAATLYVATNGLSQPPYDTWEKAVTNVQMAINAGSGGDTVIVGPGRYRGSGGSGVGDNVVVLSKALTVQSQAGPELTLIDGEASRRCVYMQNASARLEGFRILNGSASDGGGLYIDGGGGVSNCLINANTASTSGGGAYCKNGGTLQNCIITNNSALGDAGGGVYLRTGGTIDNCVVASNWSWGNAGGIYLYMGGTARNCLLTRNNTGHNGGGAYCFLGGTIQNTTITSNSASTSGGGLFAYDGGTIQNCIIYFNSAPSGANTELVPTRWLVQYSCTTPAVTGEGNITNTPLLALSSGAVLALRASSSCVDAGTNLPWMTSAADIRGRPRIFNERSDIGAYEASIACASISNCPSAALSWGVTLDAKLQLQYSTNVSSHMWRNSGSVITATQERITTSDTNTAQVLAAFRLLWIK